MLFSLALHLPHNFYPKCSLTIQQPFKELSNLWGVPQPKKKHRIFHDKKHTKTITIYFDEIAPTTDTVDGQINQTPGARCISSPGPPEFQCYYLMSPC